MSDEVYRPMRRKPELGSEDLFSRMQETAEEEPAPPTNHMAAQDFGERDMGLKVKGNIPPQFAEMLKTPTSAMPRPSVPTPFMPATAHVDERLQALLQKLESTTHQYSEIRLPSLGKFYTDEAPGDGVLHVRPMTGEEENILATPRFLKQGKAIDMIFESCTRERIKADQLLTEDRTYLLIYLRGISYTPKYEVSLECLKCNRPFNSTIDLDADISVDYCPEDFTQESLRGTLPVSGFSFRYRLSRGSDEQVTSQYREHRVKEFGDQVADDTLVFRTSLLLEEIEGVSQRQQLQHLIRKLPIADLNHIRNLIQDPPFGVDTEVMLYCPNCFHEFRVDLPLEANFFFPRTAKRDSGRA